MSWSDPARTFEPAEDRALREELSDLLGMPARPRNFFEAEASPELMALAEKLRAEAERRRHTVRRRPTWLLVAAALPFALALVGMGSWGIQQKRRADEVQVKAAQAAEEARAKAEELRRQVRESSAAERERDREGLKPLQLAKAGDPANPKHHTRSRPAELVIPVEHPIRTPGLDAQRVKTEARPQ